MGGLALSIGARGIGRRREDGCLRVRTPRPDGVSGAETVLINTAGGIAGGDTLRTAIAIERGARAVVTTQAAERVYRARDDDAAADVETTLSVEAGASLDWLPQELILFDGARLRRVLSVSLQSDARLTLVETLVFGRVSSGETIGRLDLRDLIRVTRNGVLLLHDATRIAGDALDGTEGLAAAARLGPHRAVATIVHAGAGAASLLEPLRRRLGPEAGASLPGDDLIVARLLAPSMGTLRRDVVRALDTLRGGAHPPRMWSS